MEALRQYILSVTCAVVICAILKKLLPKGGTAANIGNLMMGIFLAVSLLSPWTKLQFTGWDSVTDSVYQDALDAAQDGNQRSQEALAAIIKEKCEAYILDKAAGLHLEVQVRVELDREAVPKPVSVTVTGAASPYAKGRLQEIITQYLGIPKEKQLWT